MSARLPESRLPDMTIVDRARVHDGFVKLDVCAVETVVRGRPVRLSREVHDHGDGAAVLVFDPVVRIALLVRQRRMGPLARGEDGLLVEAIAGIVDDGEAAEEAARREAMEEAGVAIVRIEPAGLAYCTPGTVTERIHLFLAETDLSSGRGAGGGVEGEHEEIEVLDVPLADLACLADTGGLGDLKTLYLVETLRRRRPELF